MKKWTKILITLLLAITASLCVACKPKTDNTKPSQGSSNQSNGGDFSGREDDFDFGNVDVPFDTPISKF